MESAEKVLGMIPVLARLALGAENLNLFITEKRIIVAHIGKRGVGSVAGTTFLGRLSGAFEDLLKSGREYRGKHRLMSSNPTDILAADKDNFPIPYEDIVRVSVDGSPRRVMLTILSKDLKLEFVTRNPFENVVDLLSFRLGGKLVARKLV